MSVVSSNILAGTSGQAADSYEIKKGLRFNSDDSAYLSRTLPSEGNRRIWTWSGWVKRSKLGTFQTVFAANSGGSTAADFLQIYFTTSDTLKIFGTTTHFDSVEVFRDPSAWYHLVAVLDTTLATAGDRIKLYVNGARLTKGSGTDITQNLDLAISNDIKHYVSSYNGSAELFNGYLSDVHFVDGSALSPTDFAKYDSDGIWQPKEVTEADLITAKESQQPYNTRDNMDKDWSASGWENTFDGDASTYTSIGTSQVTVTNTGLGLVINKSLEVRNYLNPTYTYHFVLGSNTYQTEAITVTNTVKWTKVDIPESDLPLTVDSISAYLPSSSDYFYGLRVDGRELVDGPADNSKTWSATAIRSDWAAANPASQLFDGSLSTYTYSLGGSYEQITWDAITATSSVEVYGRGTTDSWRMIIDGSPVSVVFSGNTVADNSWRTVSTSFPCSVTGIENNNPGACYAVKIDDKILINAPSQYNASKTWSKYLTSPAGFSSGRYPDRAFYGTDSSDFAATPANVSGESNAIEFTPPTTIAYTTLEVRGRGTDQTTFSVKIDTGSGYGSAITSTGDKWQTIAISGTLTKLKLWTTSFAGENEFGGIRIDGKALVDGSWGTNGFHLPFDDGTDIGKDATATAPTLDPRGGFDTVLYTGNGLPRNITGLNFQPDLVWYKHINGGSSHGIFDSIRGPSNYLSCNSTGAESSITGVSAFNSDGFSLGTDSGGNGSGSWVAWCWKGGGSAVSNSDGTITSQVSVNQTYGFSVVTYTGAGSGSANSDSGETVGHGLSSAPKLVICKRRNAANGWPTYHASTSLGALNLQTTGALDTGSYLFAQQHPTSSVIKLGNNPEINASGSTYVAYCWSEVSGYSKFGTWTGTGGAGHKITTGFRPAFLLIKRTDTTGYWNIVDIKRGGGSALHTNLYNAASTGGPWVAFNDDGFTLTTTGSGYNDSGATFVYAAFADYPGNNFTPQNLVTEENTSAKNNFGTFTWTGNSTAGTVIETGFQPDLVWVKDRGVGDVAGLFDSVRGATKYLIPSTNGAEGTDANAISSFTSSGFTLGTGYTSITTNYSGRNLVGWAWKAGGTASSNTDGTITSSVSANPNFGFSIVSYTSDSSAAKTVGHGLSSAPRMIFFKDRDSATNWFVYHNDGSRSSYENRMFEGLNTTAADSGSIANMNNTAPSSTVFSLGSGGYTINPSGNKSMIAYCWSEVPGYSRFSSYVGNGSTTGPVIDCGFKPAFILIKGASNATDWLIWDSARNLGYGALAANLSQGESWFGLTNTLSVTETGFQITTTNAVYNTSGATYIYAAFAEPAYDDLDLVNDTPTANAADPVKGNFCTWNPLHQDSGNNQRCILSNGNLNARKDTGDWNVAVGTMRVSSGKWYWEIELGVNNNVMLGVTKYVSFNSSSAFYYSPDVYAFYPNVPSKWHNNTQTSYGGTAPVAGDIIGTALDMDAGTITFYRNGVSLGAAFTSMSGLFAPLWGTSSTDARCIANFGQQPFKYTPPAGYKKLCTTNLPDATIEDGSKHFDVKLWTGDGNATRNISSYAFNPDFVWMKERPANGWQHTLYDVIRGAGTSSVTKSLSTNSTRTEASGNDTNHGFLSGFISNGFQLTKGSQASGDYVNHNGWSYVGWAWDAGSSNTSIGVGSLNSSIYDQNSTWSNTLTVAVDQDQTWSNYLTSSTGSFSGAATNAFDNSHSNANTSTAYPTGANESVTFDISALSENLTGELEVFTWCDDSTAATKYTQIQVFEGGSSTASFTGNAHKVNTDNYQWCAPLGVFTNITKIIVSGINAGGAYFGGVSVNGIELVDNGVSVTGIDSSYPATAAFNGVNNSNGGTARTNSPPNGMKYKHPTSLTVTTLEMKCYYSNTIWLPDGTKTSVAANSGNDVWHQVPIGSGFTFDGSNYLTIERTGFANYTYLDGIRLNGKELVDTGVSLGNVPTMASTVRANPAAGFSVVSWSGASGSATVGHGLNAVPKLIILKDRANTYNWVVITTAIDGSLDYLYLNTTDASNAFGTAEPTTTTFVPGQSANSDYIAYCFAPVSGYSAMGSYTGNGLADGPFVYTGFRPRYIMWKCSSGSGQWFIHDTARSQYNYSDLELAADSAGNEYSASGVGAGERLDFLSNGFKARTANSASNSSGATYIYLAFAENPFKSSRAR